MNKHSSRQQSINALRRNRNYNESRLIPIVVQRVIESTNLQASSLQERGEYPVDFYYPLSEAIRRTQRQMGIGVYRLRDSKIHEIITTLEGPYADHLVAPVADRYMDEVSDVHLQMFRA